MCVANVRLALRFACRATPRSHVFLTRCFRRVMPASFATPPFTD